jgi:hypothetical protein
MAYMEPWLTGLGLPVELVAAPTRSFSKYSAPEMESSVSVGKQN